jgi:hypothetical protein
MSIQQVMSKLLDDVADKKRTMDAFFLEEENSGTTCSAGGKRVCSHHDQHKITFSPRHLVICSMQLCEVQCTTTTTT